MDVNYCICTKDALKYIDQIQALGDKNSNTMGFMPAEAFKQFAREGHIFYALQGKTIIGYAMFRIQKRLNAIVLTHLCVSETYRSFGIAKKLVDTLCQEYPFMHHIEVRCRRDYNLDGFWITCGFNAISEKPGRKKTGSRLIIWRRAINNHNLLSLIHEEEAQEKIIAVLDTNIVIDLFRDEKNANCLMDDYLCEYVAYHITPECRNEIIKNADENLRKKHFEFLQQFDSLSCPAGEIELLVNDLTKRFDPKRNHQADIRHLAYCITNEIDVFLTRDEWLCKQTDHCRREYGIEILKPEELYLEIEEILEYSQFAPECMMGSQYTEESLRKEDIKDILDFNQIIGQKKSYFQTEMLSWITDKNIKIKVIKQNSKLVGGYAVKNVVDHYELLMFALNENNLKKSVQKTLMRFILNRIVTSIAKDTEQCTGLIARSIIVDKQRDIFTDCGFVPFSEGLIHLCMNGVFHENEAIEKSISYLHSINGVLKNDDVTCLTKLIASFANQDICYFEKLFGSAIVLQSTILPVYFIPVKPVYAAKLFDENLAMASYLFPNADSEYAALSFENSFFSASKLRFETPCRILWYVSYDARYCNVQAFRACSIMTDTDSGTLRDLFNRHRKYGVLTWQEITSLFDAYPTKKIQAFRFENTYMLNKKMTCSEFRERYINKLGKKPNLQGPFRMDIDLAHDILESCMGDNNVHFDVDKT